MLTDHEIDLIAQRVAELLQPSTSRLVDAATLAQHLGVTRSFVYENSEKLGGRRLGDGPRGRLRFDLEQAVSCYRSRGTSVADAAPVAKRRIRRSRSMPVSAHSLPVGAPRSAA